MKFKRWIKYFVALVTPVGLFLVYGSDPVHLNHVLSDQWGVGAQNAPESIPEKFDWSYPLWDPGRTVLYIFLMICFVISLTNIIRALITSSVEEK